MTTQNLEVKGEEMGRRDFMKVSVGLSASAVAPVLKDKETKPKLPQRLLGCTGVKVSILGLGGVGFLTEWNDKDAIAQLINEAIDAGINYFDTARMYGGGKSEESLGLVMGTPRRKKVFLATKTFDRTYDRAMTDVETSLKTLRTDYLDLIQVHGIGCDPKDKVANLGKKDGVLRALHELRDQKVVRFIGITSHTECLMLKEAIDTYDFDTLLCVVNPQEKRPWKNGERSLVDDELLPLAQKKEMGIIAMKVFGGGGEAGLVGDGEGKTKASSLLRYALSQPIATAVPAVANRQELLENLEVARNFKPILDEERKTIIARINLEPKGEE